MAHYQYQSLNYPVNSLNQHWSFIYTNILRGSQPSTKLRNNQTSERISGRYGEGKEIIFASMTPLKQDAFAATKTIQDMSSLKEEIVYYLQQCPVKYFPGKHSQFPHNLKRLLVEVPWFLKGLSCE
jgi:hypothetical protein